ncbi:MAG TPA: efflux RND transporter periplasmic adaptor subunit, partial [Verrucomicrobiae bacterium]|nr:efflux RND transporter periplasmic adaptor subunit [Verrucomicrobiae bacterium]
MKITDKLISQVSRVFTGLSLAFAIAALGCKHEEKVVEAPAPRVEGEKVILPEDAPQKTSLSVEIAEPRKLVVTHLTGRLIWDDDATVRVYSPVAGRVTTILANLGQTVSTEAPLAKIDSPDFGQALADARKASSDLLLAERTLNRLRDLYEHQAAAKKDVENAEAAQASAASEKDRALARLALYGGNEKTGDQLYELRSPLAGVIVDKNINPGQEVRADQMLANATQLFAPLFVVSDPTKLWVQVDLHESFLAAVKPGQKLRIYSGAYPDKAFEGVLENIGDSLDPATRIVKVRGLVDNSTRLLKAEMYVSVDITVDAAETVQAGVDIPEKAVFMKDNQYYLFIERAPGQYERQLVKLGVEQDGKIQVVE